MTTLHLPWLELSILLPLAGAVWTARVSDSERAQWSSVICMALTLVCATAAWIDFGTLHRFEAHDSWDVVSRTLGPEAIVIDELSAPLLPLAALIYFLTALVTLRTKVRRFSFAGTLVSETILLATLSCKEAWGIVGLLIAGAIPPLLELRARRRPVAVYALHMGLMTVLLVAGQALQSAEGITESQAQWGLAFLTAAVLLRNGIVPVHCWMTDLFEHATFGTALLFVTPMVGAHAAIRLVLPIASVPVLRWIALLSLVTAVYAAGMALVQREARRFFCYLFLSHASLVLIGLETLTAVGLTGALSVWLSVSLALTGFGLTLRSMESRLGRIALDDFRGLFEHTPMLASLFLLTGLCSVGFPGTFGFIGMELLVDSIVEAYPGVGIAVVVAAALNGIAVLQAYFRLFTGTRHETSIMLGGRRRERFAVLTLALLILAGELYPQPGIASRYHAALQLLHLRQGPTAEPLPEGEPLDEAEALDEWGESTSPGLDHPGPTHSQEPAQAGRPTAETVDLSPQN